MRSLRNPELVRLDVELKVSKELKVGNPSVLYRFQFPFGGFEQMAFFSCHMEEKPLLLLHLLDFIISDKQQVVIFTATRHHVEFLVHLLRNVWLNLEPNNTRKFTRKYAERHFCMSDIWVDGYGSSQASYIPVQSGQDSVHGGH